MIGVAQGLGVRGAVVSAGSMKVAGNPAVATVKLETGGTSRTFTLTKLAWQGDERVGQVHNEGAEQPARSAVSKAPGDRERSRATLISGHSVYKVEFKLK